jgi:acylphosphatase
MASRRYRIRGRVQGVWYRASARETAIGLGLDGWARNEDDGSVLVYASGDERSLDRLEAWLRRGPSKARVESVEVIEVEPDGSAGFHVK